MEEVLFNKTIEPAPVTIFNQKTIVQPLIIEKTPRFIKKKVKKSQRSWVLMIVDNMVAFVKFISPYLQPLGISLAIIVTIRINNGSLTGTEIRKILYFLPPKNN